MTTTSGRCGSALPSAPCRGLSGPGDRRYNQPSGAYWPRRACCAGAQHRRDEHVPLLRVGRTCQGEAPSAGRTFRALLRPWDERTGAQRAACAQFEEGTRVLIVVMVVCSASCPELRATDGGEDGLKGGQFAAQCIIISDTNSYVISQSSYLCSRTFRRKLKEYLPP